MAVIRQMMQGDRRRAGSVFLLAMVALTTLLILGATLVQGAMQGLARASDDLRRREAYSLAESGVDMAICKLYENYDSINEALETSGQYTDSYTLPQGSVSYTVTAPYEGIPDTCLIDSVATTKTNRQARILVVASYMRDVDRVFEGAIFSNSPLVLHGAGGVFPDETGKGGDIYANGDITFKGTSFTMTPEGSIYSSGGVNWVPPQVPMTQVHQYIAPMTMPVIDMDYYESIATTKYTGRVNFTNANMQNLTGVIYVKGDVNIAGSYTGQAIIVATGKIQVTGSVTAEHPENDTLALISPKSIKVSGNPTVHGLIYAHSVLDDAETTLSGNCTVYGAVISDVVKTNGSIEVHYRDVWKNLPLPGQGKTQWAPVSWQELYL